MPASNDPAFLRTRSDPTSNIFAGGFGGLCALVVGHPLDTLKIHLQTTKAYSGAMDCARKTIAEEGPLALYRGMSGMVTLSLPRFAMVFHGNALGKKLYRRMQGEPKGLHQLDYKEILFGGVFSQILIVPFLVTPLERVKILIQTNTPFRHEGQIACVKYLLARYGPSSLFKGTMLTYLRDMPGFAIYFLTYEFTRNLLKRKDGTHGPLCTLTSGGLAGVVSWFVGVPLDTIKNRHQAVLGKETSWATVKRLYLKDGVSGFYRGGVPIMVRAFPANAAAFLGYEWAISVIAKMSK